MLPRRLGARFALEALFLVGLALGAGLAHIRPLYIVIVMAGAWLLVALVELTAERIDRSPVSYLLPGPTEEEPQQVFGPRPEERTVVAPPEAVPPAEPLSREDTEEVGAEPEEAEAPSAEPEPEPEPSRPGRLRSLLSRREPEEEPEPPSTPQHVKLLPRRTEAGPSRASQEVAELFDSARKDEPEETGS